MADRNMPLYPGALSPSRPSVPMATARARDQLMSGSTPPQGELTAVRRGRGFASTTPPPITHRRTGLTDARRYVANAAARTQSIVDTLMARVQTYKTFQPLAVTNELYLDEVPVNREMSLVGVGVPGSAGQSHAVVAARSGLWEAVDTALDAASDAMLRHHYEDHFLTTMSQRETGLSLDGASAGHGAVEKDGGAPHEARETPRPHGGRASPAGGASLDMHAVHMTAWCRDHPEADEADAQRQSEVWRVERAAAQRAARVRHLQQQQDELRALVREQLEARAVTSSAPPTEAAHARGGGEAVGDGVAAVAARSPTLSGAVEEQRLLWEQYVAAHGQSERGSRSTTEMHAKGRVVCDYDADVGMRRWIEGGWVNHSHRHEMAALRVQRAYRVYRARCRVGQQRAARWRVFAETLRAEEVARQQWEMTIRISATQAAHHDEAEPTLRALQFFSNRVLAVAEVRRARQRRAAEAEAELQRFAATTIQRVYRGHRDRGRVMYLRNPGLLEAKLLRVHTAAATVVQRVWRGYATRQSLRRARAAAGVIQRAFRSYCARVLAAALQARRRREAAAVVRACASAMIGRFCLMCVQRRRMERRGAEAGPTSAEAPASTDVPRTLCS